MKREGRKGAVDKTEENENGIDLGKVKIVEMDMPSYGDSTDGDSTATKQKSAFTF